MHAASGEPTETSHSLESVGGHGQSRFSQGCTLSGRRSEEAGAKGRRDAEGANQRVRSRCMAASGALPRRRLLPDS